jgi:superfamily II DNA or RNA helicase
MPTGSGKTAVLMMLPFFERANRVLVVTPSQLVRNQIAEGFASLDLLRKLGVLPAGAPNPSVCELKAQVSNAADWEALREYEVVVTTPNTISPVLEGIGPAPEDMFDLLLIDEAHHSPAKTWAAVLDAFPNAKRALFTATPYRRDRKLIKGQIVFNYPLSEARADGVFGDIIFEPVEPAVGQDADVEIAKNVERALAEDRAAGLDHSVTVRVDSRARGEDLLRKYSANTALTLATIHSGHTARHVERTIKRLRERALDGVICVNMMGEGFDFPNLKIAGLHSPHKSLGVTLQFIGRFARVGDHTIGAARFFAVPAEIEGETAELFKEDAVWQDLVINLAQARVSQESEVRARIAALTEPSFKEESFDDFSIHSLRPSQHVKVYQVPDGVAVDIAIEIVLPSPFETVYRQSDENESMAVLIGREQQKPKWSDQLQLGRTEYELVIVYYDQLHKLLFINSSRRADSLYRALGEILLGRPPRILPLYKINRCLAGLTDIECFSIGMKNRLHMSNSESYRIIAGRNASSAVRRTDGRLFHRGHIFCRAKEGDSAVTLGYSSGSKLWSMSKGSIVSLLDWCRSLAQKIDNANSAASAPGLDILSVGEPITHLPRNVLGVDWDSVVYEDPMELIQRAWRIPLTDVSVDIDRRNSTDDFLRVVVATDTSEWLFDFSPTREAFFTDVTPDVDDPPRVSYDGDEMTLSAFLNEYPLHFYFADFSRLRGEEWFPSGERPDLLDREQIQCLDWPNVNIRKEFYKPNEPRDGRSSIHEFLDAYLIAADPATNIFYDHRKGELADFLTISDQPSRVLVTLYHCKKSGGEAPGNRIEDVYEVAGQVVKSFNLVSNEKELIKHIRRRARGGSRFSRGTAQEAEALLRDRGPKRLDYCLVVVQPGISKQFLGEDGSSVLGAADEFVRSLGALPLVVFGSA